MPPDAQPPSRDRRNYFRLTIVLPVSIHLEMRPADSILIEKSVNISGGGIGFVANTPYNPGDIIVVTLRLPDESIFKAHAEVLRVDPLPHRVQIQTHRVHARFIRIAEQERQVLIEHIMRLQRKHLTEHYSA